MSIIDTGVIMRKQEYIHVHALLVEISQYLIDHEDLPVETLVEYRALDTRPLNVHESKENHHDAVMVLATIIGASLEQGTDDAPDLVVR